MTWYDLVAFLLIVVIAWVESKRGFGRALFDMLGAIIVLKLGPLVSDALAGSIMVAGEKGENQAFWLVIIAVVFAVLVVLVSRLIYQSTLLSLDYMDPVLGGAFGLVIGVIVVFFFLYSLQLAYGVSDEGKALAESFVGQEVLSLRTLHTIVDALHNLGRMD